MTLWFLEAISVTGSGSVEENIITPIVGNLFSLMLKIENSSKRAIMAGLSFQLSGMNVLSRQHIFHQISGYNEENDALVLDCLNKAGESCSRWVTISSIYFMKAFSSPRG